MSDPFVERARGLAGKITPNGDGPVRLRTWSPQRLPVCTDPQPARTNAAGKPGDITGRGGKNNLPPLRS